jgi:hypothetical protein
VISKLYVLLRIELDLAGTEEVSSLLKIKEETPLPS